VLVLLLVLLLVPAIGVEQLVDTVVDESDESV